MNKNELSGFTIYLTNDCNLRCKHCWVSGGEKADYLDFKLIQKRVSESVEMGVKYFLLTGGEPFMHPDIDDIISYIMSYDNVFLSVETNATMIHEKQIKQLSKYNDRIKLIASVDASSSKVHDEIRGIAGAFDITINTVKKLVKNGLLEQCIMAVSKINVEDIENTIKLCIFNGVKYLRVLPVQPCGRGELMSEDSVTFSVQEQIDFYEKIQLLAEKYQDDIKVRTPIPPAFLKLSKIKHYQNECSFCNRLTLLANGRYSMCGIGEAHSDYQFGIPYVTSIYDCWYNDDRVKEIFDNFRPSSHLLTSILQKVPEVSNKNHINIGVGFGKCYDDAFDEKKSYNLLPCKAGITQISVTSNGDVYPCNALNIYMGNILKQSIDFIMNDSEGAKRIRYITCQTIKEHSLCNKCNYNIMCAGGCKGIGYGYFDDVLAPDIYCDHIHFN